MDVRYRPARASSTGAPRRIVSLSEKLSPAAHVLVVDDSRSIGEVLCLFLEHDGHRATWAASLAAATAVLERESVEAVILDLRLGDDDGARLLPAIRARAPGAKVIVATGLATSDVLAWIDREGLSLALKPFDGERIVAEIGDHCARARLAAG